MMMNRLKSFRRESGGAAAIEAAFGIPIIILVILGLLQVGMAFLINAGMRHAVETGARYATIYPAPSDSEITTMVRSSVYGANPADFTITAPVRATDATNGQNYIQLSMSYQYRLNMVFMSLPPVTLSYSRRAYLMPT